MVRALLTVQPAKHRVQHVDCFTVFAADGTCVAVTNDYRLWTLCKKLKMEEKKVINNPEYLEFFYSLLLYIEVSISIPRTADNSGYFVMCRARSHYYRGYFVMCTARSQSSLWEIHSWMKTMAWFAWGIERKLKNFKKMRMLRTRKGQRKYRQVFQEYHKEKKATKSE